MFRKDPATIGEWSPQNVEKCWQLQREIVDDAWQCLNDGGMLIYSTCTFNTKENEENVRYFLEQYDAQLLPIDIQPEWHITGSLLAGFNKPVYRFIPGITRSEGLFMAVLHKAPAPGDCPSCEKRSGLQRDCPHKDKRKPALNMLASTADRPTSDVKVELDYQQAISYLRHEALRLPDDTPLGLVEVCFQGHPLGLVKNIGSRANNLYPKEWKIKTTHIPETYEPIL
jgi:NOL1/NOP2/fmu family ribosome biogenesis protein